MDKITLEKLVKEDKTEGVGAKELKAKVLGWVTSLPGSAYKSAPTRIRRGDVFMHPVFRHPCVFLEKKKESGLWLCGLLTTEITCSEILEPCKSRFFADNYFTRVMYTQTAAVGTFLNTFDNPRQIKEVTRKLKEIFS